MPNSIPTAIGTSRADTELFPQPAKSIQQLHADSDITEPTEISVPAETATTRVCPTARVLKEFDFNNINKDEEISKRKIQKINVIPEDKSDNESNQENINIRQKINKLFANYQKRYAEIGKNICGR